MTDRYPLSLPAGTAVVLLLGALAPWPYGYFVFLRWVVCFAALMVAFRAHEIERLWALWTFGLVALLFNPLIPIYLTRELWIPIDLLTAVLFAVAIASLRERAGGGAPRQKHESRSRAYNSGTRSTSDAAPFNVLRFKKVSTLRPARKGPRFPFDALFAISARGY